jgi:hypothetical protein
VMRATVDSRCALSTCSASCSSIRSSYPTRRSPGRRARRRTPRRCRPSPRNRSAAPETTANLAGAGLPDWIAEALVALYQAVRAGHAATVTNAVPEVTGRSARSYRQFAEGQKDVFTGD